MSSPSALMPRCRVKHQEKLYYTKTGERRWRGTEEAAGKESVSERNTGGGAGGRTQLRRHAGASADYKNTSKC